MEVKFTSLEFSNFLGSIFYVHVRYQLMSQQPPVYRNGYDSCDCGRICCSCQHYRFGTEATAATITGMFFSAAAIGTTLAQLFHRCLYRAAAATATAATG